MMEVAEKKQTNMQSLLQINNVGDALKSNYFIDVVKELTGSNELEIKKFTANIFQAVRNNENLLRCSVKSVIFSIITSIQVGLPVDSRKLSFLVPYKGQCTFMAGYQGYKYLIKKDPDVDNVDSELVYDCDEFKTWIDDTGKHFSLIPNYEKRPESKITHVIGLIRYKSNTGRSIEFEVMTYEQIKKLAPKFDGKYSDFWIKHEHEMLRKTVIKRLGKWYANSDEISLLNDVDNSSQDNYIYINENGEVIEEKTVKKVPLNINELAETKPLESEN